MEEEVSNPTSNTTESVAQITVKRDAPFQENVEPSDSPDADIPRLIKWVENITKSGVNSLEEVSVPFYTALAGQISFWDRLSDV